jgi:hypothetical protein
MSHNVSPNIPSAPTNAKENTCSNVEERSEEKACSNVEERSEERVCNTVEERRFSAASSASEDAGFSPRGRTFYAMTFAAIVLLALASMPAQAQSSAAATADLPAGPMQAKATTSCLECHEARIILQQRLPKAAWTKEVDKMMKWGAVVDAADRDALIDYLSTNFSPDKSAYDPPRTAGSGKTTK